MLIKRAEHAHLRDVLLSLQWKREEADKINENESQRMNRDDLKEFLKIIKIDEVSQKLWSHESGFHSHSETDRKAETYRTAEQDRATLNNLLFNFFKDESQQHCRIQVFWVSIHIFNHRGQTNRDYNADIRQ